MITDPEGTSFEDFAVDWYSDPDNQDLWVTADGPPAWRRISTVAELGGSVPVAGEGEISDVQLDDHRISFRTTAVGVPHLIKVSYFPNWRATGASGPVRAAPAFMVVIPTQEEVTLRFARSDAETGGAALTVAALLTVLLASVWEQRRSDADLVDSGA